MHRLTEARVSDTIGERVPPKEFAMRIYDITLPMKNDMVTYPGDPVFTKEQVCSVAEGAGANLSRYTFGSHTGTHLDSPLHMFGKGEGVDDTPLDRLIGEAHVYDAGEADVLTKNVLATFSYEGVTRVLFKTKNSRTLLEEQAFNTSHVAFDEEGARFLVEQGIEVVGIDYLSVERFSAEGHPAHDTLLHGGVTIIEGVSLRDVPEGTYTLFIGVLRITRSDGAPARVLLTTHA